MRDVTTEVEAAAAEARRRSPEERAEKAGKAIAALNAVLERGAIDKSKAEEILRGAGLVRDAARTCLADGIAAGRWAFGKGPKPEDHRGPAPTIIKRAEKGAPPAEFRQADNGDETDVRANRNAAAGSTHGPQSSRPRKPVSDTLHQDGETRRLPEGDAATGESLDLFAELDRTLGDEL